MLAKMIYANIVQIYDIRTSHKYVLKHTGKKCKLYSVIPVGGQSFLLQFRSCLLVNVFRDAAFYISPIQSTVIA